AGTVSAALIGYYDSGCERLRGPKARDGADQRRIGTLEGPVAAGGTPAAGSSYVDPPIQPRPFHPAANDPLPEGVHTEFGRELRVEFTRERRPQERPRRGASRKFQSASRWTAANTSSPLNSPVSQSHCPATCPKKIGLY